MKLKVSKIKLILKNNNILKKNCSLIPNGYGSVNQEYLYRGKSNSISQKL
jgi:hypothetical protein